VPEPGDDALTVLVKFTESPKYDGNSDELMALVVFALLTVCVRVDEVLPLKFKPPTYSAVIECDPRDNDVVVKVATPEAIDPLPMVVPASLKLTVPVSVTVVHGATRLTVAVKVTDWPNTDGFTEDVRVVVELPLLTVTVAALELSAGQTPLFTTARNCVVCVSVPVLIEVAVEVISVIELTNPSVEDCHFRIKPVCPASVIVVVTPLQMEEAAGVAVPTTVVGLTVSVAVHVLLQLLLESFTVTVYVPASEDWELLIVIDAPLAVKPFGPLQVKV
jgi:hypothetical protein